MFTTTATADVRDELLRLPTADAKGFRELPHEAGMDLKGAVFRNRPGPFAEAAREAGFAFRAGATPRPARRRGGRGPERDAGRGGDRRRPAVT